MCFGRRTMDFNGRVMVTGAVSRAAFNRSCNCIALPPKVHLHSCWRCVQTFTRSNFMYSHYIRLKVLPLALLLSFFPPRGAVLPFPSSSTALCFFLSGLEGAKVTSFSPTTSPFLTPPPLAPRAPRLKIKIIHGINVYCNGEGRSVLVE